MALTVPLRVVIALGLALLLNRPRRGVGLYRVAVYVPSVVPGVAYALAWLWIFNPRYGPLNPVLESLGLPTSGVARSTAPPRCRRSASPRCSRSARRSSCCSRGSSDIPDDCYHAASLDGAGRGASLWHITLPLLAPWLLVLAIRDVIVSAQSTFTPALVMTGGGPYYATLFVPLLMYETAFDRLRFGQGAAMTVVVLAVVGVLVVLTYRVAGGWGYEDEV